MTLSVTGEAGAVRVLLERKRVHASDALVPEEVEELDEETEGAGGAARAEVEALVVGKRVELRGPSSVKICAFGARKHGRGWPAAVPRAGEVKVPFFGPR